MKAMVVMSSEVVLKGTPLNQVHGLQGKGDGRHM